MPRVSASPRVACNEKSGSPVAARSCAAQSNGAASAIAASHARSRGERSGAAQSTQGTLFRLAIRDGTGPTPPIHYGDARGYAVEQAAASVGNAPPVSAGVDLREARVQADFALTR